MFRLFGISLYHKEEKGSTVQAGRRCLGLFFVFRAEEHKNMRLDSKKSKILFVFQIAVIICAVTLSFSPKAHADWAAGDPSTQNILFITNACDCSVGCFYTKPWECLICLPNVMATCLFVDNVADGFTDDLTLAGLNLDDFDQVWDYRFDSAKDATSNIITGGDEAAFNSYLAQGGSLLLIGENSGFPGRNNSLRDYLNDNINTGGQTSSNVAACEADSLALSPSAADLADAQNFGSDPVDMGGPAWNAGGEFATVAPGAFPFGQHGSGIPVMYSKGGGGLCDPPYSHVVSVAYTGCGDIQSPQDAGKVFVMLESGGTAWDDCQLWDCVTPIDATINLQKNIMDFLAPDPSASGATKTSSPTDGFPQETFTYTLVYENRSGTADTDACIYDTLPSEFTITGSSPAYTDLGGGLYEWCLGAVALCERVTVTADMEINADASPGYVPNDFTVKSETKPNVQSNVHNFLIKEPEIEVIKSVAPATASEGDTVTYTLDYSNPSCFLGSAQLAYDDFETADSLAGWVQIGTGDPWEETGGYIWRDANWYQIVYHSNSSTYDGVMNTNFQVDGCNWDNRGIVMRYQEDTGEYYYLVVDENFVELYYMPPSLPPFTDVASGISLGSCAVGVGTGTNDYSIDMTGNVFTISIGVAPVCTITDPSWYIKTPGYQGYLGSNCGSTAYDYEVVGDPSCRYAFDVVLSDDIPPKTSYVASSCTGGCVESLPTLLWSIAAGTTPLAPGDSGSVSYEVVLDQGPYTNLEEIINTAQIQSASEGPYDSNPVTVLMMVGTPTNTMTSTRTATLTNTPTATPSATPSATPTDTCTDTETATPTVTPTATPTDTLTATSTATSTFTPTPVPTLSVEKSADRDQALVGDTITYTIVYCNDGSDPVDVDVWDTVPSDTSYLGSDTAPSSGPPILVWDVGVVNSGVCGTIKFWVQVDSIPAWLGFEYYYASVTQPNVGALLAAPRDFCISQKIVSK